MIPNTVKIGWKKYDVLCKPAVLNSGQELFGQIDYASQTITLREGNKQDQSECTLIHEILHGIDDMYGIGLGEEAVTKLANAIYTLVKDNPALIGAERRSGSAPVSELVEEKIKSCANCKRRDDISTCKLLNCHRAFTHAELENKDYVTDAWSRRNKGLHFGAERRSTQPKYYTRKRESEVL